MRRDLDESLLRICGITGLFVTIFSLALCSAAYGADQTFEVEASFTRPANTTTYAASDLVANNATAGSVVPLSWNLKLVGPEHGFIITGARLHKDGTGVTDDNFSLVLFDESPTPTNGDNGALLTDSSDAWLDTIAFTSAEYVASDGVAYRGKPTNNYFFTGGRTPRTVYGFLSATAAYEPASGEEFTVILEGTRVRSDN